MKCGQALSAAVGRWALYAEDFSRLIPLRRHRPRWVMVRDVVVDAALNRRSKPMSYMGFLRLYCAQMSQKAKFKFSFGRGFARGLASPGDVFVSGHRYRLPYSSDTEAMRSDWMAVGDEIREAVKTIIVEAPVHETR